MEFLQGPPQQIHEKCQGIALGWLSECHCGNPNSEPCQGCQASRCAAGHVEDLQGSPQRWPVEDSHATYSKQFCKVHHSRKDHHSGRRLTGPTTEHTCWWWRWIRPWEALMTTSPCRNPSTIPVLVLSPVAHFTHFKSTFNPSLLAVTLPLLCSPYRHAPSEGQCCKP